MKEGSNINKSLLALGSVIQKLVEVNLQTSCPHTHAHTRTQIHGNVNRSVGKHTQHYKHEIMHRPLA